jgi:hypothetical protein
LRQNSRGTVTPKEEQELEALQTEADRLMLKRAYAYNLLKWRGHSIPSQKEIEEMEKKLDTPEITTFCTFWKE